MIVQVSRKARFTAAHFYYLPELSEDENYRLFKGCSNRHGHGHNYMVELAVRGELDSQTGMLINLKDLKFLMDEVVVRPLDHKNLNHEVTYFQAHLPTLENISAYLARELKAEIHRQGLPVTMAWLKVVEQEDLFVEYVEDDQKNTAQEAMEKLLYLTRRYDFCASHRLYNPDFPDEKNWEIYRECNNPNGHGHNYELEVTVSGRADNRTGMIVDITVLDEAVQSHLIRQVDHKHLNFDVPFLEGINPTAENLVVAFWNVLEPQVPSPAILHRIRLIETRNNTAEYSGPV